MAASTSTPARRPCSGASSSLRLFRSKAALASAIVLLLVVVAAVAAPLIAPNDPFAIRLIQRLKPPGYVNAAGSAFWLGTDTLGRDVLSRVIYGARVSLIVGLSAVLISGTIGLLLGLVSGFFGGLVDDVDHADRRHPAVVPDDPARARDHGGPRQRPRQADPGARA